MLSSTEYKKKSTQTGKTEKSKVLVKVGAKVAAGGYHTCAIKEDGSLWCWGDNEEGQIGDGTWEDKKSPVKIIESGVVSVAAGGFHTCAIKEDGSLWCWGKNDSGQLGYDSDEANEAKNTPVQIMESGVVAVAAGLYHTCAIKQDGSLWCWGSNEDGQLGDGTEELSI
jgi:alpha-tubulin suppressor-like RCC1 family protein